MAVTGKNWLAMAGAVKLAGWCTTTPTRARAEPFFYTWPQVSCLGQLMWLVGFTNVFSNNFLYSCITSLVMYIGLIISVPNCHQCLLLACRQFSVGGSPAYPCRLLFAVTKKSAIFQSMFPRAEWCLCMTCGVGIGITYPHRASKLTGRRSFVTFWARPMYM